MNSVAGNFCVIEVTPTITAGAYTANFQLGGLQTLPQAALGDGLFASLANLIIVDKDKQDAAIVVYFFDESPTIISSDFSALSISDAELVSKCSGFVSIGASDYTDLSANSVAMINMPLSLNSKGGQGTIYAVAKVLDTPTYTSSGALVFKYIFQKAY